MKAGDQGIDERQRKATEEAEETEGKPPIPRSTGAPKPTVKDEVDPDNKKERLRPLSLSNIMNLL